MTCIKRSRFDIFVVVMFFVLAALGAFALAGCAGQNVGPRFVDSGGVDGGVVQNTPSPNVLSLTDADGRWYTSGTGPTRYTTLDNDGVQTVQTGSTPRDILWDGQTKRLSVSSGSDISAKEIEFDQATGHLKIGEFSTVSSEPVRALNESLDRLAPIWAQMTDAEKEAFVAESNNIRQSLGDILKAALDAAVGL